MSDPKVNPHSQAIASILSCTYLTNEHIALFLTYCVAFSPITYSAYNQYKVIIEALEKKATPEKSHTEEKSEL